MTAVPARERQAAYRARKRAAGFRLVRGRFTKEPRVKRRAGEVPPHGDERRYTYHGCRCDECREARAVYRRDLAARRVTPDC